jgi:UDP-N-acetylglucosamine 2-epimerase (non-hydrolysing)
MTSKQNLINEGVPEDTIFVTGNTVIDALFWVKNKLKNDADLHSNLSEEFSYLDSNKKIILVTGHRRENFGQGFIRICKSIKRIALENPNVNIIYPVHLNPNVQIPVNKLLGDLKNVFLVDPQSYLPFCFLMDRASIILTDSGGIQEEAPSLGKPVLLMRDTTERPEAVEAGTVILVGTDVSVIVNEVNKLLHDSKHYAQMSEAKNPFGDGNASQLISDYLSIELSSASYKAN